ncbi:MAG: DMT family transporter, partial [Pseudomonadota bacterium]
GIWLMVLAMFAFTLSDALIKAMSANINFGQILMLMGFGGFLFTTALCMHQGTSPFSKQMLHWAVIIRTLAMAVSSGFMFKALATSDLSLVSSVLQATPLLIAALAALILKEVVGWRRWIAIIAGFIGVVLIINPFQASFDWQVLFSVGALLFLTAQDFVTRFVDKSITAPQLSALGFLGICPLGAGILFVSGDYVVLSGFDWAKTILIVLFAAVGAMAIAAAMRIGEVSAVAPFRYSRILFAVILGYALFDEWPTPIMWIGIILVFGSGIFLLMRERTLQAPNKSA